MGEPTVEELTDGRPAGTPGDTPAATPGEAAPDATPDAPGDGEPGRGPRTRRRRRRGRKVAVALAALAAGGAVTVATLGLGGDQGSSDGGAASDLPPSTAKVTKQTLEDVHDADGQLGYGPSTELSGRLTGTLTDLPESGDRVGRGKPLYEVDNKPVTLMYGSLPAYRELKEGVEGQDVKQLERNLSALGYSGFTVDEEFTGTTASAVKEWQEDLGLDETGAVELGRVVFASGEVRIDALDADVGSAVSMGGKVLSYTGTAKAVTVELDVADQQLAKEGATVGVTLPDDTVVNGRVDDVSTIYQAASGQEEEASTVIEVVVALKDEKAQKAAESYALASVTVNFTAETRKDVLTVPVSALLALAEGGFGLEVVSGGKTSYVPVTTGLFADGRVEVSGTGITEGTTVGIPK
ncbi:efflux RND transporter periplasmic adaptor subunit [Streptomyces sp. NPDC004609]|uniref:efflux RND transporter periplasmic adaptor subunit n=1 Tax=Streptomyces sp. NPDC004609 TaxID=3364704 RepID=UPI00367BA278